MDIHYSYSFNEELFRRQAEIQYNIGLDKDKHHNRKYLIFISISLFLGLFFLSINPNGGGIIIGPFLLLVGLVYALVYLNYLLRVKKFKSNYKDIIDKEVERLGQQGRQFVVEMTDNKFSYNDGDYGATVRWTMFKSYIFLGDQIFLLVDDNQVSAYVIHKSQIGQENFGDLQLFIENTIPAYPHEHRYKSKTNINPDILDS